MAINTSALGSFAIPTVYQQEQKAAFRKQQALFYTIRYLQWQAVKGNVFRDAIANGTIEPIAPGYRDAKGNWVRPEYDPDEISELYREAQQDFNAKFDAAFACATAEELADYGLRFFGKTERQLLEINRERSAERFNR